MAGKKKDRFSNSIQVENRRARFEYEILEKYEAGIELTGCEVKSIREGNISLNETYALAKDNQLWLMGSHIKPYEHGGPMNVEPTRTRRLLLKRKEIDYLMGASSQKGLTIIPLRLYFSKKGLAKLELGLCRGKQAHDKREDIKKRDLDREMRREHKLR